MKSLFKVIMEEFQQTNTNINTNIKVKSNNQQILKKDDSWVKKHNLEQEEIIKVVRNNLSF